MSAHRLLASLAGLLAASPASAAIGGTCIDACVYHLPGGPVTDTDCDSWLDGDDHCPEVADPTNADTDGDTVGDACDACDGELEDGLGVDPSDGCPLPGVCANTTTDDGWDGKPDLVSGAQGNSDWTWFHVARHPGNPAPLAVTPLGHSTQTLAAYVGARPELADVYGWSYNATGHSRPRVARNQGATDVSCCGGQSGKGDVYPAAATHFVHLLPSDIKNAGMRFTAPADGYYTVSWEAAAGRDPVRSVTSPTSADVLVTVDGVLDGTWPIAGTWQDGLPASTASGEFDVFLTAGDTVEFEVDSRGTSGATDSVNLQAFVDGMCATP